MLHAVRGYTCHALMSAGFFRTSYILSVNCTQFKEKSVYLEAMRVVPKKDGTKRVITHLSAPDGLNINDYLTQSPSLLATPQYTTPLEYPNGSDSAPSFLKLTLRN